MVIAIASGKGGTGKTTVATNLAVSAPEMIQLLDCDVEEPNAHIFLSPESCEHQPVYTMVPEVDKEKCTACGECEKICRYSAITQLGDMVMTFPSMCHSCGGCLMVCPEGAITKGARELGELITGTANGVELGYGKLRVGEAMSPPLIGKVKETINPDRFTIIDAPPGTSCPVIEAIRGCDFVLLVTEPTPFGLNDLVLAVEAVRVLDLPFGLVINRSDSGTDNTKAYAKKEGIPVLMEIQDRRDIAENYSRGVLMCDVLPEMKEQFAALFSDVKRRIGSFR